LGKHDRTNFDIARDELMSHIHRCGVLKAAQDQQDTWLDETMQYMSERYTDLTEDNIGELRQIGRRFCQPVISRVEQLSDPSEADVTASGEMAGAV